MSEEVQVEGRSYISSKRAAELSGYAQDYIGQLARKSLIDGKRIGGLWYISPESLENYKKKAEEYKPEPPAYSGVSDPGALVFFDGKEYLSAGRAAELTGYTQDYVGQLSRSGTILSRQVGNRWYVERETILNHKKEKDSLLAAVQKESVGLLRSKEPEQPRSEYQENTAYSRTAPLLNYFNESTDLVPVTGKEYEVAAKPKPATSNASEVSIELQTPIPIRKSSNIKARSVVAQAMPVRSRTALMVRKEGLLSGLPMLAGVAATIVIVISVGYASLLKENSAYAVRIDRLGTSTGLPAAASLAFTSLGNLLEPFLTHELIYVRQDTQ